MLGEHDRQLYHLLVFEFLGRYAVQDVGFLARRRRELDDSARVHPRLHLTRQFGSGSVRLVHDHERAVEVHEVDEGEFNAPAVRPLKLRRSGGQGGEVRLHLFVVGVDLAANGVADPQGLDGADDDAAFIAHVVRAQLREIPNVEKRAPDPRTTRPEPAGRRGGGS